MNDHYHRLRRKIVQKIVEVFREDPKECISQPELDKHSEHDSVRDTLRGMGLDPQKDELTITREMAASIQGRFSTLAANNLNEIYILLSYDPDIREHPLVQIR